MTILLKLKSAKSTLETNRKRLVIYQKIFIWLKITTWLLIYIKYDWCNNSHLFLNSI
jgi:hypothetical protein